MAEPDGVAGLQHTFTTDSLTFTWDAAEDADKYRLTLSLDGAEVATQVVTDLTATFDTLEDGTQYDLAIQAENAQGDGPIAYYQASTGYLAPAAPVNLRQFEERIIAVICRWDHPNPDKVHDTEVQLLYGDELVMADAFSGPETERTFVVPMASTDYLLRVRAGNPGGWSAWAEGTVASEDFPLIDSRLGVMGATYQEDVLHTDTWDGASDQLKGVVEEVRVGAGVSAGGYALTTTFKPAVSRAVNESAGVGVHVSVTASSRSLRNEHSFDETALTGASVTVGSIMSRTLQWSFNIAELAGVNMSVSVSSVLSARALYQHDIAEAAVSGASVSVSPITSEVV